MNDHPDHFAPPDDLVRVQPSSIEAETCVIGSLFLNAARALPATKLVCAEDFYRPAHQILWRTLLDMIEQALPIDLVTFREALLKREQLATCGGIEYVVALVEGTPSAANAEYYARIVRDKAILRATILSCTEAVQEAYSPTADLEEILHATQGGLYELDHRLHGSGSNGDGLLADAGRSDLARLRAIASGNADPDPPVPTGFAQLDKHMDGGPRPGEMLVLAAGPEKGKSSLALNIAGNVCAVQSGMGGRVLFVSAEMTETDLWRRVVSSRTGILHKHMRVGDVSDEDLKILGGAVRAVDRWRFAVCDRAMTVKGIGVEARRRALLWGGLDLIVVDYLQRMRLENPRETKSERVGAFSCGMKQLAMTMGVPVILISQINREGKKAQRPPELGDLRDSGSIEDDADYVVMMHQTQSESPNWSQNKHRGYGRTQVAFRKGRNSGHTPWGAIYLVWRPWIFRFDDDELVRKDGV